MKRIGRGLQSKFLISLALVTCVTVALITTVIAMQYRERMERFYTDSAFGVASYAANSIDAEKTREYYRTGKKDAYYEAVRQMLLKAKQSMGLTYFYVVVPEAERMVYIWDGAVPGAEPVSDLLDHDDYYGGGNELMHAAFAKDAPRTILVTRNEEYGYLASAYVAILDKKGAPVALASVDISMDMVDGQINRMILLSLVLSLVVMTLCITGYYFYLRRMVIRPLDRLAGAARNFTSERERGEGLVMDKVRIASKDEIGDLYAAMSKMEVDMTNYLDTLRKVTAERERVGAELNVAKQIQADMLPSIFPAFPNRHDFDIYATMTPAKEVGGDFYDFFLVDETHLAMVIADVSGKGVPAALFMVIAKTLIKNRTLAGGTPAQILADVNDQLCEGNIAQLFVTVWLGILDLSTGKGVAANAGHEHPAVCRKDGAFELVEYRHSPAVATMEGMRFREHEFELRPGDTLFVYTDGVPEATDATPALYGCERMLKVLNNERNHPLRGMLHAVKADIDAFIGEAPQFDDITMLALTFYGSAGSRGLCYNGGGMTEREFSCTTEGLAGAQAFLESVCESPKPAVVMDEIVSNIVRCSGASAFTIRLDQTPEGFRMVFIDDGKAFDPTTEVATPDITASAENRAIGGLGIFMVKKMSKSVSYARQGNKNVLTVVM